jgi:cobalt/nickel transport system permease protein
LSKRTYSKHVPDFRYVTFFAETGNSHVHRANPWTKLVLLAIVVGFATVLMDIRLLLMLYLVTLLCYALARLPLLVLLGWYTLPVMFVLSLAVLYIFTEHGDSLISWNLLGFELAVKEEGVLLAAALLLRALAVVTFSLMVFMSTRYNHIAQIASKTMPGVLASIFLLTYRFLFETSDEISDVLDAMRARGGTLVRSATRETRSFAGIVGMAFVHAFDRAESISKAMEARGFSGRFVASGSLSRPSAAGYALMGLATAALLLATYSRYSGIDLLGW